MRDAGREVGVLESKAEPPPEPATPPPPPPRPPAPPATAPAAPAVSAPKTTVSPTPPAISQLRASASPFTFAPLPPAAPAPPASDPRAAGRHTPSPVLSAPELYARAGWLTPQNELNVYPGSVPGRYETPTSVLYPEGESDSPDEPDDSDSDSDIENFKIPETLEDIYRISNRNRRRQRARKAAGKDKPPDADEPFDPEFVETEETRRADREVYEKYWSPEAGGGDCSTEEFLKLIGWDDLGLDDEPPLAPAAAAAAPPPRHKTRGKKPR